MSFAVEPGETIALVGPSGAGKSTLLNVLLGFVRPTDGRVLVGGADLTGLDLAEWRSRIAWVPQRPHLYAGTIAENVRLARPDADDAAVRRALADAGALEFVDALPEGVDTVLGEDGTGLSAGQRQRLALARAFLADRPVLLLDEPTAALDGATEAEVVEAVRRLAVGRTVLLVVHRPALLGVADRVVRLAEPAAPDRAEVLPKIEASVVRRNEGGETHGESAVADAEDVPLAVDARGALARVRAMSGPRRGRLALALLLGSLALGSAVGLMATSGWLISRASQQPPVLYLMVAVTATRAFGIGRAVFRYAERLVSHDAVLRMLADTRVAVYRRLERLAPAGLRRTRRGDLLSRLVADVDALQDYWLRWLLPAAAATVVSAGAVGFTAWLLPEAGAVLAAGLLAAGLGVPLVTGAVARRAERVHEVLDAPEPVREPERPRKAPESPFPVAVMGLTARHAGQDRDALAGLDLILEEGRRIAVVGPSGSGKTTLAQALLRFLDTDAGSYTLGGVDAHALDGDDVRRLVGLCAQDAHLFDSSVRENLLLARKDATEADLRDALGRARLLDWSDGLPDGLDTLVGEHGARLSGGQRQRLALARALLADFPVLVLDEPAEHLDLPTADALTADLLAATEGRTTLLITHRLAGLEAVDEVVVLDEGRVVQRGAFAELAATDGPLRAMVEREEAADLLVGAP